MSREFLNIGGEGGGWRHLVNRGIYWEYKRIKNCLPVNQGTISWTLSSKSGIFPDIRLNRNVAKIQ